MRALNLAAERQLIVADVPAPPAPAAGEVQIRVKAVGLNHIDVWGYRGMAFAKRKFPLTIGAEAAGEIAAVGDGATRFKVGQKVAMYGAKTCGVCKACQEGRDNLCEDVGGLYGFHVDGFAQELINMPERLVIPVPDNVSLRDAACTPIAYSTVQHMLFDNAKLQPGETVLVHAGGSGIGSVAIMMAKAIGCTVITTVGDDSKFEGVRKLGADHIINYRTDRFEGVTRKLTKKKGVDVVFEHVGADTFNGSLLCLKRGGRLVTCGATSGPSITLNLMQLFQQQYRIIGSFGATMRNIAEKSRQDVGRHAADHRHRSVDRRRRPGAGAHGEPSGVWQDHRSHLMQRLLLRTRAILRTATKPVTSALVGAVTVALLRTTRYFDPIKTANALGKVTRRIGPLLREDRIGRENLTKAFPEKSSQEIEKILTGVWDNLGRIGAEFAHLDHVWDHDPAHPETSRIEIGERTHELFAKLRTDGKPALIFAAHTGNWELPALAAVAHGLNATILYRPPNSEAANKIVQDMRALNMGNMVPAGPDAPYKLGQALQNGEHVAMLIDQYFKTGVDVDFFGRPARTNPLLARLRRHVDCPIHGVRIIRLPNHRFRAELSEEIPPVFDADGKIDVQGTMQAVTSVIESWVREYPDQWLWLHRRWR